MNPAAIEVDRTLEAAVHTLINGRCRHAYLHDMRGGLQAIAGAFELLARLARSREGDSGVVEKAAAIAKRALANHENAMLDMINQITCNEGTTGAVDFGELIDDVIRFLRNDVASKQIRVSYSRSEQLIVQGQKQKLRLLMLGLIALRLDDGPAGSELVIRLGRSDGNASLELSSEIAPHPRQEQPSLQPFELVLAMARQWLPAFGGRVELRSDVPGRSDLRVFYPAHS